MEGKIRGEKGGEERHSLLEVFPVNVTKFMVRAEQKKNFTVILFSFH